MVSSVILTVVTIQPNNEYDMELPANIPGAELCEKLLEVLKSIDGEAFNSVREINLRIERNGRLLGDDQTLEDAELWDGSIVTILTKWGA